MSTESLSRSVHAFDPSIAETSRIPEMLRFGFDAVLFDKDGTLVTGADKETPSEDIIRIESDTRFTNAVQILPGRRELIWELKSRGVKIGVVTSDWRKPTEELLERMGVSTAIDVIVGYDDLLIAPKPHPEPFLKARSVLRAHPRRAIMIGDSPDDDIAPAKRLGMKTVLVPSYRWGRGIRNAHIPGPESDLVVLRHGSLTANLLFEEFGPNSEIPLVHMPQTPHEVPIERVQMERSMELIKF